MAPIISVREFFRHFVQSSKNKAFFFAFLKLSVIIFILFLFLLTLFLSRSIGLQFTDRDIVSSGESDNYLPGGYFVCQQNSFYGGMGAPHLCTFKFFLQDLRRDVFFAWWFLSLIISEIFFEGNLILFLMSISIFVFCFWILLRCEIKKSKEF